MILRASVHERDTSPSVVTVYFFCRIKPTPSQLKCIEASKWTARWHEQRVFFTLSQCFSTCRIRRSTTETSPIKEESYWSYYCILYPSMKLKKAHLKAKNTEDEWTRWKSDGAERYLAPGVNSSTRLTICYLVARTYTAVSIALPPLY